MITQERLKELLRYDPLTGTFTWIISRGTKKAGSVAGSPTLGYTYIEIDKKKYKASRLAWLYIYGTHPSLDIDHINRIRNDDRIENLREVSKSENMKNCAMKSNNTSGFIGVTFAKDIGKWRASIRKDRKGISLGCFDTPEEAHEAYRKASFEIYPRINGGV